jgi:hypothetical protein
MILFNPSIKIISIAKLALKLQRENQMKINQFLPQHLLTRSYLMLALEISQFLPTVARIGRHSEWHNTENEFHMPRERCWILCRHGDRLPSLSFVRRARTPIQLRLSKCHTLSAAHAHLRPLVYGRLYSGRVQLRV